MIVFCGIARFRRDCDFLLLTFVLEARGLATAVFSDTLNTISSCCKIIEIEFKLCIEHI